MAARTATSLGAGAWVVAFATAVLTTKASLDFTARVESRSNRPGSSPTARSSVRSELRSKRWVKSSSSVGERPSPTEQRATAGAMASR